MNYFSKQTFPQSWSHRDEHVPGKEGADTKPVEDDVDEPEFVLWTIVQILSLGSHFLSVMLFLWIIRDLSTSCTSGNW